MKPNGRDASKPDRVARPWEGSEAHYTDGYIGYRNLQDRVEEAVDVLLRRKWWVIGTALVVFHLVLFYTFMQEPLYSASSLVLVEERGTGSAQDAELRIGPRDLFARSGRSLQNELIILRSSRSLRQAVAERLVQQGTVPRTGEPITLLTSDEGARYSVRQVAMLLEQTVQFVPAEQDSDVISIIAYSRKAAEAAYIANTYLSEYLALTRQSSRSQLSASRSFLETQAEQRNEELQAIEAKIEQYKRSRGAVALDQEGQNLVERIATVEARRDEAQVELQTSEASLASLEEELQSIRPEELSRRVASGVEKELEATQARIAELELSKRQVLLRGNPEALSRADSLQVAQIDRRIQELRRETQRLSDDYVGQVLAAGSVGAGEGVNRVKELRRQMAEERVATTGLNARIEVLSERLQEYEAELASIPEQAMQLAQLERDRTYAEERYQSLVDQLQQTRIQEETELGYADTVTEAAVPRDPVRPRTLRNLVVGAFFGFLFGLGLAVGRDRLDSRLYKPDTLREVSGLRLLGTVPNIQPVVQHHLGGGSSVTVGDKQLPTSLVAQVRPRSAAAEAYRHIRTNIQFSTSDRVIETLLVTSPGVGDGKSLTAANMAIVMAQAGRRTLLVDADLRRPRAHALFDVDRAPGLAEALEPAGAPSAQAMSPQAASSTEAPLASAGPSVPAQDPSAQRVPLQSTPLDNLHVLTAGAGVDHPAERVGSAQLRALLETLRGTFDFIIIDTPPVLAATDATYLATQCDGTMVVTRAGVTTSQELAHTLTALEDVGAPVIGTVFNGFDVSMAYGYKLRYRNYTRYGPYDEYHDSSGPASPSTSRTGWASARDSLQSLGQAARTGWSRTHHSFRVLRDAAGRGAVRAGGYTQKLVRSLGRLARAGWTHARWAVEKLREARDPAMARVRRSVQSFREAAGPVMAHALSQTQMTMRDLGQATRSGWTRLYRFLRSFSL